MWNEEEEEHKIAKSTLTRKFVIFWSEKSKFQKSKVTTKCNNI